MNFDQLHAEAHQRGMEFAAGVKLNMVVITDGRRVYDPIPICGFGWVEFAGNTAWGRWAKANGIARKAYPTGLSIWVRQFEQSYDMKLAYARGYADRLQEAGIEAYADGRLD